MRFIVVFGSCVMLRSDMDESGRSSVLAISTVKLDCQMLLSKPLTPCRMAPSEAAVPVTTCAAHDVATLMIVGSEWLVSPAHPFRLSPYMQTLCTISSYARRAA